MKYMIQYDGWKCKGCFSQKQSKTKFLIKKKKVLYTLRSYKQRDKHTAGDTQGLIPDQYVWWHSGFENKQAVLQSSQSSRRDRSMLYIVLRWIGSVWARGGDVVHWTDNMQSLKLQIERTQRFCSCYTQVVLLEGTERKNMSIHYTVYIHCKYSHDNQS